MRPRYRIIPWQEQAIETIGAPGMPTPALTPFAADVARGLSAPVKTLSSKYFYDDEGSRLFERITELPEYYLTRCEQEILEAQGDRIAEAIGVQPYNLVELGAGDGRKTSGLIESLLGAGHDLHYAPIDISEGAMRTLEQRIGTAFPQLEFGGLVCDYFTGLRKLKAGGRRNVVLFLGSNIGNFSPADSVAFLHRVWATLNPGDLLYIGFDLKKDVTLLRRAYCDSQGVTAAFNLNLLNRINRELGGDFGLEKFGHYANYNFHHGAMESFLVSLERQTVTLRALGRSFSFEAWEAIHTECSHKYSESDIRRLALDGGFETVREFFDHRRYFCDALWRRR